MIRLIVIVALVAGWADMRLLSADGGAERPRPALGDADRGYRVLTELPLLPGDFDREAFDHLWTVWPEPLRSEAAEATPEERYDMTLRRYGLTRRPGDAGGRPLQYVVSDEGTWTMNCFSCHGGSVYGETTPGAPNNRFALQTLTEEIGKAKIALGRLPGRMELGALFIPLGTTNGTTNAVVFGMGLMNGRDADLNVVPKPPRLFTHHDMDAPPWWYFYKRSRLYIDGFAEKGHRGLMQFALVPENDAAFFREHEDDFRDVYSYLDSLRAPKFPGPIDAVLAEQGRAVFENNCAECHGTYGESWTYPERRVPLDVIGTDPVRLRALTVAGREKYSRSWFAHAGGADPQVTVTQPDGYVAPPLDGVWASAPYFHNGSVPTLWDVLHPAERPDIWRPVSEEMDAEKIGLTVEPVDRVPSNIPDPVIRRSYFDTSRFGKSNRGHSFPDQLTAQEKRSVLEYLKTL